MGINPFKKWAAVAAPISASHFDLLALGVIGNAR
jgi:hypothetical protein